MAQLRWRAARAAIALGMIGERGPERLALYDRALIHARRATELAPTDNDARYWRAAAAGRRANKREAVKSARLAMEAYEQVTAILAVDSLHAGAHHALGMLHFQVRRTPRLVRFLAGRVLRIDIANQASDVEAERHLRRAVELDSGMVLYQADLAVFYGGVKKVAEQEAALARLVTMRPTHPADVALVHSRFANLALKVD